MTMAKKYVTVQGDTWDLIALREMGNERHMTALIEANPNHNTVMIFSAGVELVVPETMIPVPQSLPPWKR